MTAGRLRGALAVGCGVLLLSPDATVIRLVDLDVATVLFFRGACMFAGFLALIRIESGRWPRIGRAQIGAGGLLAGCLIVAGNTFFVTSIRHANAALALVILASAPVFTAVLSSIFTREHVPQRTWAAALVILVGSALILVVDPGGGERVGIAAALCGSLSVAGLLVLVRRARLPTVLPWQAVGALLTAVVALPFASPLSVSAHDLAILPAYSLLLLPASLALIMVGPRYLTAPEVSLLTMIETVLGPAWVWIFIGQPPASQALLAAPLIILTLVIHAILSERALRAVPADARLPSPQPARSGSG